MMLGTLVFASSYAGPINAAGASSIEVLVNTKKMAFPDAKPFQDSQGSVMVPIRFVSEALGAKVSYSKSGKTTVVGITNKDHIVKMTVGQTTTLVDGEKKSYGTKIILKQNRTFVPLRLVSEGLGQKVEWDKVGRWVWIGNKEFRSTDDKEFKLTSLNDFKAYTKSKYLFQNSKKETLSGVKIVEESDLPIQLADGQVIYSIQLIQKNNKDYIVTRSTKKGTPIEFLLKNEYSKGRNHVENAFINNGDKTGSNFYPVVSTSDKFRGGTYVENYDWTKFRLPQADYILFDSSDLQEYAVVLINPFK